MKKYFLLLLLSILLTACNSTSVTLEKKNVSNSDMIDLSLYDQIINRYNGFTKKTINQDSNINNMAFLSNHKYYTDLYNTIVDIDNNGTPELLISVGTSEGAYKLLDMYTVSSKNKLIRLTTKNNGLDNIGERMILLPLQDGSLLYKGSASAISQHYILYKFDQQGTHFSMVVESEKIEGLGDIAEPIDINSFDWISIKQ
ncbi:hypothetical protein BFC22_11730 [Carnobacterium divergens]|nr:hypothetical protein BFC22_11730 [Carnobacterium divergens]